MPEALSLGTELDPCVHCGFCLPACPTYLVTGDEAESPRGRIVLMRAFEQGEIAAGDRDAAAHLDHCLGCRGCEPACPSGVRYGRALESVRAWLAERRGLPLGARVALFVFAHRWLWIPALTVARWMRDLGIADRLAGPGRTGFGFAMLAASGDGLRLPRGRGNDPRGGPSPGSRAPIALFGGCVMSTLFRHVHDATGRVMRANGHPTSVPAGQGCCGALHAHAGDLDGARRLAARNVAAFGEGSAPIVVNSAGCGALLKDYGHLLGTDAARAFAARVRDVSELLAADGPRPAGPLPLTVTYDAPCHLQHAQGVVREPIDSLAAVAGLAVSAPPGSDRCCGSAGIFSLLEPEMSRAVLARKVEELRSRKADVVATGNPGCLMQIGAGLRLSGSRALTVHPVELLDAAYGADVGAE
jgi:glycolate oxidase iron-sulfur subunit